MIPLFIKYQEKHLQEYASKVRESFQYVKCDRNTIKGVKAALNDANHAYSYYLLNTRNFGGKFKSYIPLTKAFKSRINAARKIDAAFSILKQQDTAITKPSPDDYEPYLALRRASSVKDIPTQPRHFNSPIRRTRSADNSPFSSVKIEYVDTVKPTRLSW